MREFKTVSLADQVFEKLENDIITGVYPRGDILTELRLVELGGGFRLLPYRTVDGEGFLLAFRPEAVYVDGELRRGYWAAMSPRPIAARSGCTALMNGEEEG